MTKNLKSKIILKIDLFIIKLKRYNIFKVNLNLNLSKVLKNKKKSLEHNKSFEVYYDIFINIKNKKYKK